MKAKALALLLLAWGLALAERAVASEVFQWIDARGVIHFTDDYSRVPAEVREAPEAIVRHSFAETQRYDEAVFVPPTPTVSAKEVKYEPVVGLREQMETAARRSAADSAAPENVTIIVVNNSFPKKPCRGHSCSGRFDPDFNDRRYIHPDVFNGGTRQYIQPNAFARSLPRTLFAAPTLSRK
ncbi:MAG TPA: DUF4124 domain-containing protein [Candidatus Acidoferrales bacterium]|nr:DUF4124 domain-containing protein [Candidatus Acidoferrales bacterium]